MCCDLSFKTFFVIFKFYFFQYLIFLIIKLESILIPTFYLKKIIYFIFILWF